MYKSSPRIRIRWLSELSDTTDLYEVDFYDHTDLECVLTSLDLERVQKNYRLAGKERERIENILRRAIDVESGVLPRPSVTAENPDGCECRANSAVKSRCLICSSVLVDLSLYTSESQIDRKSAPNSDDEQTGAATASLKRKSTSAVASPAPSPKVTKGKRGRPSKVSKSSPGRPPKTAKSAAAAAEALSEDNDDQDYSPVVKKKKSGPSSAKKATPSATAIKSAKTKLAKKVAESPVSSRTTPRRTVAIVRSVIEAIQDEENQRSDDSDSEDDNVALVPKKSAAKKQKVISQGKTAITCDCIIQN